MTPIQLAIQKIKYKRLRTLGTTHPFCATCGECRWWARYERHHIAGRDFADDVIRLCVTCHNGISIMQTLLPPLEDGGDPRRDSLIAMLEGGALLFELAATTHRQAAEELRARPVLPPPEGTKVPE